MIRNYLKTAIRNLLRNKVFSLITILGLSGGLTCAMLILTFVVDELSYDKFHSNKEQVYRLRYKIQNFDIGRVPPVFYEHMEDFFPEIEAVSRLWSRSVSVIADGDGVEHRYEEDNVNFADPAIFQIFDFELVEGNLFEALQKPFTVILNREMAEKYFPGSQAVGQSILMEGNRSFQVIAVVEDFPSNSHTHFDMLVPYENMYDLEAENLREGIRNNFKQNWMVSHSPTYALLEPGTDVGSLNRRFENFVAEKIPENQQKGQSFEFQPLLDIHLNDEVQAQAEPSGSRSFIFIFIAVGLLTLLIACINFVNLSTAKSLERAKEIGMRKVMGAWKSNLIYQFLGESYVITIFAAVLSIGFTFLLLPQLNALTNKTLGLEILLSPEIITGYLAVVVLTGLLAGIYPAFFVTKVSPIHSLKGVTSSKVKGGLSFRKGLIILQFLISIMLISCTLIVFDQLDYMRNKPLGFNKDFLITVPLQSANFNSFFGGVDTEMRQKMNAFEETLAGIPGVVASTASSTPPGFGMVNRNVIPEGFTQSDNIISPVTSVDYDFLQTYEIPVIEGRGFSDSYATDHTSAFVINEEAVKEFKFGSVQEAIGKSINLEGKEGKVVGVVQDYNFVNLTQAISPLIMEINVPQFNTFSIRLNHNNVPRTLGEVERIWNDFFPEETFDYSFLDQSLADNYQTQEQFGTLISYFALWAIFISCLGSYGLILFIAGQRRKEVGVRKVLGATVAQVVFLLAKRLVYLVFGAIVLAVPLTVVIANYWLEDFSYRIDISPWSFIIASSLTVALVALTISAQSYKAAIANPIKALRSE